MRARRHTGRKTTDRLAAFLRERAEALRRGGMRHREIAQVLGISLHMSIYYANRWQRKEAA